MEELGVYDDEMDTTDPRWTTLKSMPILLGKRWWSESFLYIYISLRMWMLDMGLKKIDGFPSFSCCSLRIQVLSLFLLHSYSVLTRHTVIIRCIGEILLFL